MACAAFFAQLFPYIGQGFQILVDVFGTDIDLYGILYEVHVLYQGKALHVGMFVGKDEQLVERVGVDSFSQLFLEILTDDNFLFAHICSVWKAKLEKKLEGYLFWLTNKYFCVRIFSG